VPKPTLIVTYPVIAKSILRKTSEVRENVHVGVRLDGSHVALSQHLLSNATGNYCQCCQAGGNRTPRTARQGSSTSRRKAPCMDCIGTDTSHHAGVISPPDRAYIGLPEIGARRVAAACPRAPPPTTINAADIVWYFWPCTVLFVAASISLIPPLPAIRRPVTGRQRSQVIRYMARLPD